MSRSDQRRWAEVYLRGLLLADGRKSVRRIADSMPIDRANQSLQQFINQSPWDWEPVRARIARRVEDAIRPDAWVVNRVIIPKRGDRSVGVQRRFVPEVGRTVNSQLALSVSLASQTANVPVNWRIALVGGWSKDLNLRRAAYIPDSVTGKPEWAETMDMLEEMVSRWDRARAPVVGEVQHLPDPGRLLSGMADRDMEFVFQVDGSFPVMPNAPAAWSAGLRPGRPWNRQEAVSVRERVETVSTHPPRSPSPAPPRAVEGRNRLLSSLARLVGPRGPADPPSELVRIVAEVDCRDNLGRFWVTNMTSRGLDEVMALIHRIALSRQDMEQRQCELGLYDFEGRSYRGLHHHLTMVSAAFAYSVIGDAIAVTMG
ncbi:IS701 family transposase [Streptomyces polygonati]|uniref:IS701 family transposase n=1 Tax=Streptomyces polygonati TaxID=1617087 RepID=A0ABV8HU76_9ACTN